jgi:arsenate reductase
MSAVTIYHNPRCSKSRQTLALLEENGITPNIVLYLQSPPDEKTLKTLIKKLGLDSAQQLVRNKEADYKQQGLSKDSTDAELITAMACAPKLIERPIVVKGSKAVLGRPPENVLALI